MQEEEGKMERKEKKGYKMEGKRKLQQQEVEMETQIM